METNKKEVWDYTLYIKGIYGRNRSVKFGNFDLVKQSEEKRDHAQVLELAREKIQSLKPKGSYWFKVMENPMTIRQEDGYQVLEFKLMSGIQLHAEQVQGTV